MPREKARRFEARLACTEIHDDERAGTVTEFTSPALDWFLERGIVAERLLSDNAWAYVKNKGLWGLLTRRGVEHWRTKPYLPQTNGKVERLLQTMDRESARGSANAQAPIVGRRWPH